MKLAKYTLFSFLILLLSFQSYAQPDMRRMNISIGIFSPSATSYDYEGAIGVIGSTGYTVDDIEPGDMFWDDLSRYRVDSVEVTVAGSVATVWITDIYGSGVPQSGRGTLGKPTTNLGLQPLTENGSNFITEAQEAKILTFNLNRMDSLAGDGNGIISALPEDRVEIESTHSLVMRMDTFNVDADVQLFRSNGGINWLQINDNSLFAAFGDIDGNYEDYKLTLDNSAGAMSLGSDNHITIEADDSFLTFNDNSNGYAFINYNVDQAIIKIGDVDDQAYSSHLYINNNTGRWGIGDLNANLDGFSMVYDPTTTEFILGSDNVNQVYIDESGYRIIENANGYGNVFNIDSDGSIIKIGDLDQSTHGNYLSIDLADNIWGLGDLDDLDNGVKLLHDSGAGAIYLGELSGSSGEQLKIDYSTGVTSLGDVGGLNTGMQLHIDNSTNGVITLGDKDNFSNGTKLEIDNATENISFSSENAAYNYTFPTTNPGANQVLGEGASDDNVLEWVTLSGADGNGLISALPVGPVTIDANNNTLIIDSTATTRITAVGAATGTMVVSGSSSLPNTLSHIAGADTAQVNIRAAAGIDLKATRVVSVKSDTLNIGDRIKFKATSTGTNELFYNGTSNFSINTRPDGSDAFGLTITGTGSTRTINLGDNSSQYNQHKLSINDVTGISTLGGFGVGFKVDDDIVTIGDYAQESDYHGIVVDNTNGFIKIGDIHDADYHFSMHMVPSDHIVTIGDVSDNYFSTKVIVNDEEEAETITINANNGTTVSGSGYTYLLPTASPEAGQVVADQNGDGNLEFVDFDALDTLWLGTATYAGSAALDVGITDVKIAGMSVGIQEGFTVVDSALTYLGSPGYVEFTYNGTVELFPTIEGTYGIAFIPYRNSSALDYGGSETAIRVDASEQWFQPFGNTVIVFANTGDVFSVRYSGTAGVPANLRNISVTARKL